MFERKSDQHPPVDQAGQCNDRQPLALTRRALAMRSLAGTLALGLAGLGPANAFVNARQAKPKQSPRLAGALPEEPKPALDPREPGLDARIAHALALTRPAQTLRLAFEVELASGRARRRFRFDPRLPTGRRVAMSGGTGQDDRLAALFAAWVAEPAPDGRLFPDLLGERMTNPRRSMAANGDVVLAFAPTALPRDTGDLAFITDYLEGEAVLPFGAGGFSEIRYRLETPVRWQGGVLQRNDHIYRLGHAPRFGLSFIEALRIEAVGQIAFQAFSQALTVQVLSIDPFFAVRSGVPGLNDKPLPR